MKLTKNNMENLAQKQLYLNTEVYNCCEIQELKEGGYVLENHFSKQLYVHLRKGCSVEVKIVNGFFFNVVVFDDADNTEVFVRIV